MQNYKMFSRQKRLKKKRFKDLKFLIICVILGKILKGDYSKPERMRAMRWNAKLS